VIAPTAGLVAVLGTMAVLVLLVGIWYPAYARTRVLRRRLGLLVGVPGGADALDMGGRRRSRGLRRPAGSGHSDVLRGLEDRLERAALDITAGEIVGAMAVLAGASALIAGVLWGPLPAAAGFVFGAALPLLWINWRHGRRQRAFLGQLSDTIALLASTVRAGHSLLQGLEQVAHESVEPTRSAIEQVVREIGVGSSQSEAMERLAARFPSEDLDLIVASINVQHEVGGSLAQSLDDMAAVLRERQRIEGDIRALTAQQRYSAYVLALLPIFVAAALLFISRDYISLLFEGTLRYAAIAAGLMVLVGFILMRRIASVDV
jgi:tight adherence protein B